MEYLVAFLLFGISLFALKGVKSTIEDIRAKKLEEERSKKEREKKRKVT